MDENKANYGICLYLGDKMPEAYIRVPFYCACASMRGAPVCDCASAAVRLSRQQQEIDRPVPGAPLTAVSLSNVSFAS